MRVPPLASAVQGPALAGPRSAHRLRPATPLAPRGWRSRVSRLRSRRVRPRTSASRRRRRHSQPPKSALAATPASLCPLHVRPTLILAPLIHRAQYHFKQAAPASSLGRCLVVLGGKRSLALRVCIVTICHPLVESVPSRCSRTGRPWPSCSRAPPGRRRRRS